LALKHKELLEVLAYSKRPYRKVEVIKGDALSRFWSVGKNSFRMGPPNAVLSAENQRPVIVKLTDLEVTNK
jgi:hypothetical protein